MTAPVLLQTRQENSLTQIPNKTFKSSSCIYLCREILKKIWNFYLPIKHSQGLKACNNFCEMQTPFP